MTVSRQVQRQNKRLKKKFDHRLAVGSVDASGKSRHHMSKARTKVLHGISVAVANSLKAPIDIPPKDRLTFQADQRHLAYELNAEFIARSNGRGGKKPQGVFAVPSIAMRKNHTNPIGHFA